MLKQPNFFYNQPSILPKFDLSTTFGLSFMIRSVAPIQSSTFYAHLITKIGNRNLKLGLIASTIDGIIMGVEKFPSSRRAFHYFVT